MTAFERARENPPAVGAAEGSWDRRFVVLILSVLVVRIVYAALFPLDLAPDESYYWDWGRRPDWGYFSKPPMVGWLMGLAGWIGNDSVFVLKLVPALFTTGALVWVFLLGRDMFGGRAGFWSAVVLLATPANAALSTFFTIDPPLFFFWSASLYVAWRWRASGFVGSRWALALAVSLGLGSLTKQIHLLLPVLFLVFLALQSATAGERVRWLPVLGVIGASLLFLLPPVLWNWRHDWITFRHTADELEHRVFDWGRSARFVGEFVGGQAGLGGGISWLLMMGALGVALASWRRAEARVRFLLLLSVPGLLAFLGLSFRQRVEQNWPLVFYTAVAVLLGGWAFGQDPDQGGGQGPRVRSRRLEHGVRVGVLVGGLLAVALMAIPFVLPGTSLAGTKSDPTARIRGWREFAGKVQVLRAADPVVGRAFLLAPDDRYAASALAFYLPDRPRAYCWEEPGRPESQYGIWGRPGVEAGSDALVVARNGEDAKVRDALGRFREWRVLGEVEVALGRGGGDGVGGGRRPLRYTLFLGRGYAGSGGE